MRILLPLVAALSVAAPAAWADPSTPYYRYNLGTGLGQTPPGAGGNNQAGAGTVTMTPSTATVREGDATQAKITGPSGATFTLNGAYPGVTLAPDGTLTYVAGDDSTGSGSIGVTGTWTGGSAVATFTVAVTPAQAWVGNASARSGQSFSMGLTTDMNAAGAWSASAPSGDVSGLSASGNQNPPNSGTAFGTAPTIAGTANQTRTVQATYKAAGSTAQASGQGTLTVYPPLSLAATASRYALVGRSANMSSPSPAGQVGALKWTLSANGTDVTNNLAGACAGLAFDKATGVISGNPSGACDVALSYVATDDGGSSPSLASTSAPATSRLVTIPAGMTLSYPNGGKLAALAGSTGTALTATISGGCPPLQMAVPSPALPFGISQAYDSARYPLGTIFTDGSGAGAGTSAPTTVVVSDSCGQSASATIQTDIQTTAASVAAPTQLQLPVGSAGSTGNPTAAGFGPGLAFELASGTLPGYLSVNPTTGAVTGTVPAGTANDTTWSVSVRAKDSYGRSAASPTFTVSLMAPTGSTSYTLPVLDSPPTNFVANTPVTVARLYDGNNVYNGQGNLPLMWCSGSSTCEVVMRWSEPKLWNLMRISATSADVPDGMVVYYDSGNGVWNKLWSGRHDQYVSNNPPDNTLAVTFPDTVITRVRIVLQGYPGGWGHLDEWRWGYNTAPVVP